MVQLTSHYPDGQRQVPAQMGDLVYGSVAGPQIRSCGQPDQQLSRLGRREGVQAYRVRIFQRGQMPAAGDHDQGARSTWQ